MPAPFCCISKKGDCPLFQRCPQLAGQGIYSIGSGNIDNRFEASLSPGEDIVCLARRFAILIAIVKLQLL